MSYTVATVRARVQRKLDNPSFDSQTILDYINDYQRELFNKYRLTFMEKENSGITTTVSSTALSGLATDIQVPLIMRLFSPVNYAQLLPYVEYEDVDLQYPNISLVGNGPPIGWTVFAGTPQLINNADTIAYSIKMKYIKTAIELTSDGDTPEIPVDFSELLVLGTYKRCLEHDDNFDQAQVIQQKIDELEMAINERYRRQHGTTHIMRAPYNTGRGLGRI